ncbi:uncharacterized protein LOC116802088 [Drosophila sechellia]|uniref:uncharacterized protein LOC116802088 n=1 Tax=Drosophila sechellia TaxID=7238 RepID=UPI0013DDAC57|nr:uncharacterized protein LOC116802088 [Drosophila sechellia]
MTAKNAACEKAWRDFIIAKMTPKPPRIHQVEIAVHGVEREGYVVRDAPFGQCCPAGRRGCRNSSSRRAEGTKEAASACAGTQLLGLRVSGDNTTACSIWNHGDNQEFHARQIKKIARLNVAVKVCNSLFGTNFAYGDTVKTPPNRRLNCDEHTSPTRLS